VGKGEEMTQTLYAHMNKRNKKKEIRLEWHAVKGRRGGT
jgi:hypothetical protein